MDLRYLPASLFSYFKRWFPQRNLIIVSEHKVRHVPVSGAVQCLAVSFMIGSICWGAYSTGSYMAAKMALKTQNQTLRTIADQRVSSNFNAFYTATPLSSDAPSDSDAELAASASGPMFTLSAMSNDKLYARVAFLEQRIAELQAANTTIIQRVRDKTAGRIGDLENIIRQAGLNPDTIKKQVQDKNAETMKKLRASGKSQGGPYIPTDTPGLSHGESLLYANLNQLSDLQFAVDNLPLANPIPKGDEQSRFGHRIDPFTGRLAFHSGIDLAGPSGSGIYSTADGKVTAAGRNGAYGNAVDVEHEFGISTRYAHLSRILVSEGQRVRKGDLIGIQGSSGRSTGAHLHYEVRYHDKPVNPKSFLNAGRYVFTE